MGLGLSATLWKYLVRHCRFGSVWMIGWQKHEHKIELSCRLLKKKKNFSYCCFQKHEDESESWLHRQVRVENTAPLPLCSSSEIKTDGVCCVCLSLNESITRRREAPQAHFGPPGAHTQMFFCLCRMNRRSSPKTDTSFSSPEQSLRVGEESFSTSPCPPLW